MLETKAVPAAPAFHGGRSFDAVGVDFAQLERGRDVVSADVLDAWFDPSPTMVAKLRKFLPYLLRTSPPVQAVGLVAAIARARGIPEGCILTGGGSSDLIFTCVPRLGARRALILDPMYGEHAHVLESLLGLEVARFQLDARAEYRVDTDGLLGEVARVRPDLVVLVNPNSPTGQHWERAEVLRFLDGVPASTTVLVDETYIDYAGPGQSIERDACQRANVLVLKSMSKVYALSGVRVGYLVGAPEGVRELAKWMPPWAVSLPAQVAAVAALEDAAYYEGKWNETHRLREELARSLERLPVRVFPSTANFLLVDLPVSAEGVRERMEAHDVFVRNCDSMSRRFGDRFLRIAVKRRGQNRRIAGALRSALG